MLLQGLFNAVLEIQLPMSEKEEELLPEANQNVDENLIIGDITGQSVEFKVHLDERFLNSGPF